MTQEAPGGGEANGTPPRTRSFRTYRPAFTLTPEQTRRQSDVLRSACEHLPARDTTVAFLNAYNKQLGGVPLQLALESDHGLLRVEQLLVSMNGKNRSSANPIGEGGNERL